MREFERGYRPDIDGLRAISVIAVVLFHAGAPLAGSGYAGVDVFFVISGFLIGGMIYREALAGEFSFVAFYARRARRILPALLLVIATTLLLGFVLLTPLELTQLASKAVGAVLGFSNILYWRTASYFVVAGGSDPLLMTWSLGVEEQFYLLAPLAMLLLIRYARRWLVPALALGVAASLVLAMAVTKPMPNIAYFSLFTRAWELGAGMILAIAVESGRMRVTGRPADALALAAIAAMIAAFTLFDADTPYPGFAALLPVGGAIAAIAAGQGRVGRAALGAAPLAWIGRRSYGWYLWHWPLLALLSLCTVRPPSVLATAVTVALSFLLAMASYRFVERPLRERRDSNRRTFAVYGVALAAVLVLAMGIRVAHGIPGRAGEQVAILEAKPLKWPCIAEYGVETPDLGRPCVKAPPGRPVIGVIGDSHGGVLVEGLARLARERGWGHAVLTKGSCRPYLGVGIHRPKSAGFTEQCARFTRAIIDRVTADPSIEVVLVVGNWTVRAPEGADVLVGSPGKSQVELFEDGLRATVEALRRAGKRVYLLEDVPEWRHDPGLATKIDALPVRRAIGALVSPRFDRLDVHPRDEAATAVLHRLAKTTGAGLLPLRSRFCAPECRYAIDDRLLYFDYMHVSAAGALYALTPFADELFGTTSAHSARKDRDR